MADLRIAKYPTFDCSMLTKFSDSTEAKQLENAIYEWQTNQALQEMGRDVSYNGYVQCFCDEKFSDGYAPDTAFGSNGERICQEYYEQIMPTLFFSNGITVVIVVVNVILKQVTIRLI